MREDKGSIITYAAGRKKEWRKWLWNRIVERCQGNLAEKLVVYLLGPEDNDRQWALKKGFKNRNLIGVDLNADNVARCRKLGGFAIKADINHLLLSWGQYPGIDVIVADFCSGYTRNIDCFSNLLIYSGALNAGAVISINLLRGRDKSSNLIREVISDSWGVDKSNEFVKHRGGNFLFQYMNEMMHVCEISTSSEIKNKFSKEERRKRMYKFLMRHSSDYMSYKSLNNFQVFDTIVFNHEIPLTATNRRSVLDEIAEKWGYDKAVAGRVAALKAVRTNFRNRREYSRA